MDSSAPLHPLWRRYGQLRAQLHTAYTAAVWDGHLIDQIAAQVLLVEKALATGRPLSPTALPLPRHRPGQGPAETASHPR